jgi:hypothetical protein
MQQFLDWCVHSGSLEANPWDGLLVKDKPEVQSHRVQSDEQVSLLLSTKGNLGRFVQIRPNAVRLLKSKAAEREVPLHPVLEQLLDQRLPSQSRLFPSLNVDRVVKRYACRCFLFRPNPLPSSSIKSFPYSWRTKSHIWFNLRYHGPHAPL